MLDLTPYVGKLYTGESTNYLGSAFLLTPTSALTAAHCIGDRETHTPFATSFKLQLPDQTIFAELARSDFAFDVALLTWQSPVTLMALPFGILPDLQSFEPDKLPFHGYGFPRLFPTGIGLTGTVSRPNGRVDEQRAMELLCKQGGAADMKGASGSPVCVNDCVVGIIRHGTGGARVIFATHLADITNLSPEIAPLLPIPSDGITADSLTLYVALCLLTRLSFEDVQFRVCLKLGLAASQLLPNTVPTAERAQGLINKCTEADPQGLAALDKILNEKYPHVLRRARQADR